MLLTRLPMAWLAPGGAPPAPLTDSVWAFSLVGAVVGSLAGVIYWACFCLGLPPAVAAAWTLAAALLITGALHEDGLADTADGFGGGRTRERRLEIMRDSRIGSFGALALMLSLAARGTAIAILATPLHVATALIVAGALGRTGIVIVLLALAPARSDGLAAELRERRPMRAAVAVAVAAALAATQFSTLSALAAGGAALAVALGFAWTARRQIGGYTGDVLGATSVLVECAVLSLMVTSWAGFRVNP
jgi:adenosylcobinamide-GDP ribazoletransferase